VELDVHSYNLVCFVLSVVSYHRIVSYHIAVLKRQNRLKVGTDEPKLKVEMQSVSDDDVQKRLVEKPRFELAAKGVLRLGRCYIFKPTSHSFSSLTSTND